MEEEKKDVIEESSTSDVTEESSTQEAQETQETGTPTQEQGETQETEEQEQAVPYDRFKEVNDEKNWYKNQLEQSLQKPQQQVQPQQQPVKTIDAYITNAQDAETKMYWQNMKKIVNETATEIADSKVKATEEKMVKLEKAYMQREGQRLLKEFKKDNPGIKSGSPEEKRVIDLMNQGYPMEHAALIAQGETGFKTAENRGRQQAQQKFQQKKQANVETSPGISNSSLPTGKSERELIGEALDETPAMK